MFIVIVDEEHLNKTVKAEAIISFIDPKYIVRVSATTKTNKEAEYILIDELDVINAGLITRALYINENVTNEQILTNENDYLLTLAINKRKVIKEEYLKRKEEQKRFLSEVTTPYPINFLDCDYEHEEFIQLSKGLENEKEGGPRCLKCYRLRLLKTALKAQEFHFDYFGTSLTVSPYKNAQVLNQIGEELQKKFNVKYLYSDFKKRNGYKRSIELSKDYHLYRQDYCGCSFSKAQREQEKKNDI